MVSSENDMHGCRQGAVVAGQYILESVIAETALATFFRARDQMTLEADGSESELILASVSDNLVKYPAFENTLQRVLEEFDRPNSPLDIAGAYRDDSGCWLIYNENGGKVVSDLLPPEVTDQGLPVNQVRSILFNIFRAAKSFMSRGGYGFLEPGAILCEGNTCKLLNAPLAVVFRVLTGMSSSGKDEWLFDSPYISPEVARGMLPSSQDDTFSLAVIAYRLLSNKLPYPAASMAETVATRQPLIPLAQLGANGWKVLGQGLSLQRARRQASPYTLLQGFAGNAADMEDLVEKSAASRSSVLSKVAVMAGLGILISYASYHVYQGTMDGNEQRIAQTERYESESTAVDETKLKETLALLPQLNEARPAPVPPVAELAATVLPEPAAVAVAEEKVSFPEGDKPVADVQKESERLVEEAILAAAAPPAKASVKTEPGESPVQAVAAKPVESEKTGGKAEHKLIQTATANTPTVIKEKSTAQTKSVASSRKKTMYASAPVPPPQAPVLVTVQSRPPQRPRPVVPVRQVKQVSPNTFVVVGPTPQQKTVRQVGANTFIVASD